MSCLPQLFLYLGQLLQYVLPTMFCCCFLVLNMSRLYSWAIEVSNISLMHSNEGRIVYNRNILVNQLISLWLIKKKWKVTHQQSQSVVSQHGFRWGLSIIIKRIPACSYSVKINLLPWWVFSFFSWKPE